MADSFDVLAFSNKRKQKQSVGRKDFSGRGESIAQTIQLNDENL